jgi:hypothetical protein
VLEAAAELGRRFEGEGLIEEIWLESLEVSADLGSWKDLNSLGRLESFGRFYSLRSSGSGKKL